MNKTYEEISSGVSWEPTSVILQYRRGWDLHREGSPAIILYLKTGRISTKNWFLRGQLHRSGGPAIEGGTQSVWYLHGALLGVALTGTSTVHS